MHNQRYLHRKGSLSSERIERLDEIGFSSPYNKGFEFLRNQELGAVYPRYNSALEAINSRMVDLLVPFRSRYLYHPKMLGSASIKRVLPAFVPELNYNEMEISDGDMASRKYQMCLRGMVTEPDKEKIYRDLRRYCEMDTYAEVKLIERLYEMGG